MLAPIILFVFNRPKHTLETLLSLSKNELADQSTLFIFSDGYNDTASDELILSVNKVRSVIREQQWCRDVIIEESTFNRGLANSVIYGVTKIVNEFGKVIVLEDDLLTANTFLKYMNHALDRYKYNMEVMQISGFWFNPPRLKPMNSSYFLPFSTTWGWGTWKRVWNSTDFECLDYRILKIDKNLAYQFNQNGSYNYKKMFEQQMELSKISSWGIRFYWNVFRKKGLVLYPDKSLVVNIGWDNSGTHKDSYQIFSNNKQIENYFINQFPVRPTTDPLILKVIREYIRSRTSIYSKVKYRILNLFRF